MRSREHTRSAGAVRQRGQDGAKGPSGDPLWPTKKEADAAVRIDLLPLEPAPGHRPGIPAGLGLRAYTSITMGRIIGRRRVRSYMSFPSPSRTAALIVAHSV